MKVYLDNCCFNRPFDDQDQMRIKIESEAKLEIQDRIRRNELSLVWSFIQEFENDHNPHIERQKSISEWRLLASEIVLDSSELREFAASEELQIFQAKDALHLAASVISGCSYYFTTDDGILKKRSTIASIKILNPIEFFTEEGQ